MTEEEFRRNTDNFCYRHPDRQSFVLCQRCLRTICGECQTPAPVGVVCPECLKQQARAASPAQRKAERRWSRGPVAVSSTRPTATYAIIAITVLTFVVTLIPGAGSTVQSLLAFYPPLLYPDVMGVFQPWRLLSVSLVHSGILHLGLNMLALFMVGRALEPMLGRSRFIALYLLCTLGGSVAVTYLAFSQPVVGASGAVFGLFGAFMVIARRLGADVTQIAVILGINLVLGFIPSFNISWQAHVGGLVTGLAVGYIFTRTRNLRQRSIQTGLLALVAVIFVVLLLVRLNVG